MRPKSVLIALIVAFGIAVAFATATTIRQVHTANSLTTHQTTRT
ncbi:hypothetical protein [Bradyrhizobium sp. NP1]|nr:hypothetical protein [Bradyrhizobium sp. NP1]WJR80466.1 hypothetical protein QOU61_12130 [Bradyrhizobium sp. NP1]